MHTRPPRPSLMDRLAGYIAGSPQRTLPDEVVEKTKHHILDTIAAMVSGTGLAPGRAAVSYARTQQGAPEASVLGTGLLTSAVNASLANGMLAHADETDDSHAPSLTHPGCGVVASALAMAEREAASGQHLLRAVALGYDIGCRVPIALHPAEFRDLGHSTHSIGPTFGAAAAAGSLAGLDARQVRFLLSFAAQQASGLSCWMRDVDHVEKAFDFGGMPARNGVTAATMVAHGFTGVEDVFSGERNFFDAHNESGRIGRPPEPDQLVDELGERFEVMRTSVKRWSVGSPIQAALDALDDLVTNEGLEVEDVDRMVVRVSHQGANTVDDRDIPSICLQHLCALMLVDSTVTFASAHDESLMQDPRVLAVRSRVELYGDDAMTAAMPSRQAVVEVTTRTGAVLRRHVENVVGTPGRPMTRAEVERKGHELMAPVLGAERAQRLCAAVWGLDDLCDVRQLRGLWAGLRAERGW